MKSHAITGKAFCYPGVGCFCPGATLTLADGQESSTTSQPCKALSERSLRGAPGKAGAGVLPKEVQIQPCLFHGNQPSKGHKHPAPPKLSASIKPPHSRALEFLTSFETVWLGDSIPKDHAVSHIWRPFTFADWFRLPCRLRKALTATIIQKQAEEHTYNKQQNLAVNRQLDLNSLPKWHTTDI